MRKIAYFTFLTGIIVNYTNVSLASGLMPEPSSFIECTSPFPKASKRTIFDLPTIPEGIEPPNFSGIITAGSGAGIAESLNTMTAIINVKRSDPLSDPLKILTIEIPESSLPASPESSPRNLPLAISPEWSARPAQ